MTPHSVGHNFGNVRNSAVCRRSVPQMCAAAFRPPLGAAAVDQALPLPRKDVPNLQTAVRRDTFDLKAGAFRRIAPGRLGQHVQLRRLAEKRGDGVERSLIPVAR